MEYLPIITVLGGLAFTGWYVYLFIRAIKARRK
jgi:hypothetical protein